LIVKIDDVLTFVLLLCAIDERTVDIHYKEGVEI